VGTDQTLGEPAYDFQKGPLFVVEASSPRPARHMKMQSFSEVLQVWVNLPLVAHNNYVFIAATSPSGAAARRRCGICISGMAYLSGTCSHTPPI